MTKKKWKDDSAGRQKIKIAGVISSVDFLVLVNNTNIKWDISVWFTIGTMVHIPIILYVMRNLNPVIDYHRHDFILEALADWMGVKITSGVWIMYRAKIYKFIMCDPWKLNHRSRTGKVVNITQPGINKGGFAIEYQVNRDKVNSLGSISNSS